MKVEGFVTLLIPDDVTINPENIPVKLDVFNSDEDETSQVVEVIETDVINKQIQTIIEL
jgi:hypothetical protein